MEEEINALFRYGFKLAREVESTYLAGNTQPELQALVCQCQELATVFSRIVDSLQYASMSGDHSAPIYTAAGGGGDFPAFHPHHQQPPFSEEMTMKKFVEGLTPSLISKGKGQMQQQAAGHEDPHSQLGDQIQLPMNVSITKTRPTKRKDEAGRRTVEVEAPLHGNTEIPPEDGFTWRKYGQKEILGARYPRGYFRCTHQKLYNCPAKKQVQRLDSNPCVFRVTYRGEHSCHMSSTAPAVGPQSSTDAATAAAVFNSVVIDMADALFNSSGNSSSNNSMEFLFPNTDDPSRSAADHK